MSDNPTCDFCGKDFPVDDMIVHIRNAHPDPTEQEPPPMGKKPTQISKHRTVKKSVPSEPEQPVRVVKPEPDFNPSPVRMEKKEEKFKLLGTITINFIDDTEPRLGIRYIYKGDEYTYWLNEVHDE